MFRARTNRLRRIVRWSGTGLSAALLATFIASHWWMLYVRPHHNFGVGFSAGGLWLGHYTDPIRMGGIPKLRVHIERNPYPRRWWFSAEDNKAFQYVLIPLWCPLILIAVPTAILWRRHLRRAGPGHCAQCGYDLCGLDSRAPCPECGFSPRRPDLPSPPAAPVRS